MAEVFCDAEVVVKNALGLHMRPAKAFVSEASKFRAAVAVERLGGPTVNGKSIMGLMSLLAPAGTRLRILARGPDAKEAVAALVALVARGFDEA
jgi:phosphocarrier protein